MKVIAALLALVVVAQAIDLESLTYTRTDYSDDEVSDLFQQFLAKYPHDFPAHEHKHRLRNFHNTLVRVAHKNALEDPEDETRVRWGVTKFSDLSPKEFKARYLMNEKKMPPMPEFDEEHYEPVAAGFQAPNSFTWQKHSPAILTPVKNQEQCGSCWAFSATETIESAWAMAGNSIQVLAPQQIVDCDSEMDGCNGGWPVNAMQYVVKAGGMETEKDYPYTARNGPCKFKKSEVVTEISGWRWATHKANETEMAANLVQYGPLSIAVDAEPWMDYNSGIFKASQCGHQIDHGVQVVGYGAINDGSNGGYWTVRNSWGADWGEAGFIQLQYGKDTCSVATHVAVPIVDNKPPTTSSGNSGNSGGSSSGNASSGGSSGGSSGSSGYSSGGSSGYSSGSSGYSSY